MRELQITSRVNPRLKALIKQRQQYCFFEGEKLVRDLLVRSIPVDILVVDKAGAEEWRALGGAGVEELWLVSRDVLARLSQLADVPSVLAVTSWTPAPVDFARARVVIGLDMLQDPGNAGTVFRCAAAFGVDGVVFTRASVHFSNSKFLRAAQNTLFEVPHQHFPSLENLIEVAVQANMNIYLTSSHPSAQSLLPQNIQQPCLILLGNEGQGLPDTLTDQYPTVVIPQTGKVESLNVGICACLLMYQMSAVSLP